MSCGVQKELLWGLSEVLPWFYHVVHLFRSPKAFRRRMSQGRSAPPSFPVPRIGLRLRTLKESNLRIYISSQINYKQSTCSEMSCFWHAEADSADHLLWRCPSRNFSYYHQVRQTSEKRTHWTSWNILKILKSIGEIQWEVHETELSPRLGPLLECPKPKLPREKAQGQRVGANVHLMFLQPSKSIKKKIWWRYVWLSFRSFRLHLFGFSMLLVVFVWLKQWNWTRSEVRQEK